MSQITSTGDLRTLTGYDGGGAVSPLNGNITIVGGAGIAVTGSQAGHTITITNTGAEASTFVTDAGTNVTPVAGVVQVKGFIGDHILTTGSNTNLISIGLTGFVDNCVVVGNAGGGLDSLIPALDGEVLIGATGSSPEFNAITSSSGSLSFTTGPNTLDMNVVGGGIPWSQVAANISMQTNHGYIAAGGGQIELLLPVTSAVGDVIKIVDLGLASPNSPYKITQNAGQYIGATLQLQSTIGAAGSVECDASADEKYAATTLRCVIADTLWVIESSTGLLIFN